MPNPQVLIDDGKPLNPHLIISFLFICLLALALCLTGCDFWTLEGPKSTQGTGEPLYTPTNESITPMGTSYTSSSSWGVFGGIVAAPKATSSSSASYRITGKAVYTPPKD